MNETPNLDKAFETPRDLSSKFRLWFDRKPICVLTIGKTASSAIIQGLIDAELPAYQAHSLSRAPQDYLFVSNLPKHPLKNAAFKLKTFSWLSLTRGQPKRFITTFRDPFARNMSAFFEQSRKLGVEVEDMATEDLASLYEKYGPHDATRTWFADNLTKPFGIEIDMIDLTSESTAKLTIGRREFLFMKYENQVPWEEAISSFVGKRIHLKRRNDSSRKSYSDAMSRLKVAWQPSPQIVKRSLDRKLWDAIYTETEKERIRARWNIPQDIAP